MDRRKFVELTSLGFLTLGLMPTAAFSLRESSDITTDDLLGRANPNLFGSGFQLRKEAFDAFTKMSNAALQEGIKIQALSSYRNFAHQNRIWERKYKKYTNAGLSPAKAIDKIIRYSTIPGTSRHHWGTDIDVADAKAGIVKNPLQAKLFQHDKIYGKLKTWLDINAATYGFYEVYTNSPSRKGFNYEPWHLSYRPLSCQFLNEYIKLDLISILRKYEVMGSEHFSNEFIQKYRTDNILDINPDLLPS